MFLARRTHFGKNAHGLRHLPMRGLFKTKRENKTIYRYVLSFFAFCVALEDVKRIF
jgi:hypothetical protein